MLSASWIMMSPSYESPPGHVQVQKASFDFSSDLTGPSLKLTYRKEKRRAEDEYPSQPAARSLQSLVSSSRSSLTLLATLNMLPVSLFWQSDLSYLILCEPRLSAPVLLPLAHLYQCRNAAPENSSIQPNYNL